MSGRLGDGVVLPANTSALLLRRGEQIMETIWFGFLLASA
jgi:hypothetical protein